MAYKIAELDGYSQDESPSIVKSYILGRGARGYYRAIESGVSAGEPLERFGVSEARGCMVSGAAVHNTYLSLLLHMASHLYHPTSPSAQRHLLSPVM